MNQKYIYRIYTEALNRIAVCKIVSASFEGFTVLTGFGYWKGQFEQSLIIEIIGTADDVPDLEVVCNQIREHNKQQAVMLTGQEVSMDLL